MQDLFIAGGFVLIAAVGALIHQLYSKNKPLEAKLKPQAQTGRIKTPPAANAPPAPYGGAQAFLKNRIEDYDGRFTLNPFGHDLLSPPRRDVPVAYHGTWLKTSLLGVKKPEQRDGYAKLEITANELLFNGVSYPVVLVDDTGTNFLPESETREIAVVCEETEENGWLFWMMMLSLQENGQKLVNVESVGSPWTRLEGHVANTS